MSTFSEAGGPEPFGAASPLSGYGTGNGAGPVVSGVVTGGDGAPLTGATVTLTDPRGRQLDHAWSDDRGEYRLSPPTGGTYIVICAYGRFQPNAALVAVAEAPVRHDISLTGTSSIGGTVRLRESAQPVGGAIITLIDVRGTVAATTVTGPDGAYELNDVSEGAYTVAVAAGEFQPVASAVNVPLGARLLHDVELAGRCRLIGTVRTASSGRPVAEALVTVVDAQGGVVGTQITGPDGLYDFDDLPEGEYTVTASGYAPVAITAHAAVGDTRGHDIRLGLGA